SWGTPAFWSARRMRVRGERARSRPDPPSEDSRYVDIGRATLAGKVDRGPSFSGGRGGIVMSTSNSGVDLRSAGQDFPRPCGIDSVGRRTSLTKMGCEVRNASDSAGDPAKAFRPSLAQGFAVTRSAAPEPRKRRGNSEILRGAGRHG